MAKIRFFTIAAIALLILAGCKKVAQEPVDTPPAPAASAPAPTVTFSDTTVFLLDSIRRGEGPFNLMERLRVDRQLRQKVLYALANEADLTTLRVGERFAAVYNMDTTKMYEFIYYEDLLTTHRVRILRGPDSVTVDHVLDEKPSHVRHHLIRGALSAGTLDAELKDMGMPPRVAQLAMNVLECKISFRSDARIGDKFELLMEETIYTDTVDGAAVEHVLHGRTQLLYVMYEGERVKGLHAYKYFDGDKSSYNAHYTEDGEALIFMGLRYPLDKIHITSPYGMRRHPVTGQSAMHHGVDYRASVGTPVYAVAEGRVAKSAFDELSGHHIAIRHNDGYTSYYMHMSKKSVAAGALIKARQVIGLSGNTGRSNGPHLHFGFKQPNGAWMNPVSKRMIATPKLSGDKLEKLTEQITEIRRIYKELDAKPAS